MISQHLICGRVAVTRWCFRVGLTFEEFFGKIEGASDLAALATEYDAKITPMLNGK